MDLQQFPLDITSSGRSLINITDQVSALLSKTKIETGLCQVFLRHTSASLILCENADSNVLIDLENYMHRLVPDGDQHFKHIAEGPDDMSAHIRSVLTANSLTIPVNHHQLALGTWQGIFLWEHRLKGSVRHLMVTIYGEK